MITLQENIKYRNLSSDEINKLELQNCIAIDGWNTVFVEENFIPDHIKSCVFSGINYLGVFHTKISNDFIYDYAGIYNAQIHNCTIGSNSYIKNIGSSVRNYIIKENCIVLNVDSLQTIGDSTFGNGIKTTPVNEAGGRDIYIYNQLSVHTAYIMAFYSYRPELQKAIIKLVKKYAVSIRSKYGIIENNSIIKNCGTILNVNTGSYCTIEGVTKLEEGSINSSKEAPTYVGFNVNASHFIFATSSTISDGAYLNHCFVGQGCEISNHYTAENSVFFSNSQCLQGEGCAIFAGPYTVTHHKSTLLIAGYYSFFNAGSGTNQSNHMYKIGPVHQGIIERGSKTGSDSYILWPGKIGAFTMVLGRHYNNPDISELPFSYLIEDNGKSVLMPGQNLFSVGTTRDVQKWPARDKRKGTIIYDQLITEDLNPYTINTIINSIKILKSLQEKAGSQAKQVLYKNTQITVGSINRGIKLYEQALIKYIGDELINTLKNNDLTKLKNNKYNKEEVNQWIDLGGLICKKNHISKLELKLKDSSIDIKTLNNYFADIFNCYTSDKTIHVFQILKHYFNIDITSCSSIQIIDFINLWIDNNKKIFASINMDAKKEFNVKTMIGFGQDGDINEQKSDFLTVRGSIENNSFIVALKKSIEENNSIAKLIISSLNN